MLDKKNSDQILDYNALEILDSPSDLLFHVLYKNNLDESKIALEINQICEQVNNQNDAKRYLKKSLRQLAAELSNKVNARSVLEGIAPRRIVEDILINSEKVQYTLAEGTADLRKVLHLRKKIFADEEGYPPSAVTNGFEKDSLHVMATVHNNLIGCASIVFDGDRGIPLDGFLDLKGAKDGKKVVEVDKLAVIGDKRKGELSFHIMWLCYTVARFWGAQKMFIFTLSKKKDNLKLYEKFGFKQMGKFNVFAQESATALMLDFDDVDTYEKKLNTTELLRLGKKLLNKFSLKQLGH